MIRYTSDSRDRVRDAVDMLALVSARTELRRAGVDSYFGLCPFHDERTPSFHVRPDAKHYHCFGCQASGDPFTFVMETEGLEFREALESLAERFGVRLETAQEDPAAEARRQRRDRLHALLSRAAEYYARYLWAAQEAAPARDYLLRRGLTEDTLREFQVGYAPSAWDRILLASRRAGFTDEELVAAGLAQRSSSRPGQVYDRFRERIVFPAADARGRIVGFGARAMRENQRPKYLNTADGEIYHKREILFGIHLARSAAARSGRMVLAEGYTDVLALHQAGVRNAVGIMGTSLTEEQIGELQRVARTLELCLDADRAGQEAMLRAARLAAGRQLELRVVPLPAGADPAELAQQQGEEALRSLVESSRPFVVFRVEQVLAGADTGSAEGRDKAAAELAPVLSALPPSVLRDELMQKTAARLDLSATRLASLVSAGPGGGGRLATPAPGGGAGTPGGGGGSFGGGGGPAGGGGGGGSAGGGGGGGSAGGGGGGGSAGGGGAGGSAGGHLPDEAGPAGLGLPRGEDTGYRAERAFLVLCVALPDEGERALAAHDPDQLLRHESLRRAARHLRGRAHNPLADLPADDDELARTIADLVARAARGSGTSAQLEHARLVLELSRLERAIRRARLDHAGDISGLAREREEVRAQVRGVVARLERQGAA